MIELKKPRHILLDIEGTTTPISFVHEVLFPFALEHVKGFLTENISSCDVQGILKDLHDEYKMDGPADESLDWTDARDIEKGTQYIYHLIRNDVKSTPLKALQGMVWKSGYEKGILKSPLYDDVSDTLKSWNRNGIQLHIYSSGSIEAQKLLFAHTTEGDLTSLFSSYWDTQIGKKTESSSYHQILENIGSKTSDIVFISDNTKELEAAMETRITAIHSNRPDVQYDLSDRYPSIQSFREILFV